ncbi:hypothetical protein [Streptomyces sp. NPDC096311]
MTAPAIAWRAAWSLKKLMDAYDIDGLKPEGAHLRARQGSARTLGGV